MAFWFALKRPKMRFKRRTKKKNSGLPQCFFSRWFFLRNPDRFFFVLRLNRFRLAVFGVVEPLRTSIREKLRVGKPFWYEEIFIEQLSGWPCGPGGYDERRMPTHRLTEHVVKQTWFPHRRGIRLATIPIIDARRRGRVEAQNVVYVAAKKRFRQEKVCVMARITGTQVGESYLAGRRGDVVDVCLQFAIVFCYIFGRKACV